MLWHLAHMQHHLGAGAQYEGRLKKIWVRKDTDTTERGTEQHPEPQVESDYHLHIITLSHRYQDLICKKDLSAAAERRTAIRHTTKHRHRHTQAQKQSQIFHS